MMLTSKQLIEKTGISRATLNNYIALGILPKPVVMKPTSGDEKARQLGYFPDDAVDRVDRVQRLKKEGLSMAEIVSKIGAEPEGKAELVDLAEARAKAAEPRPPRPPRGDDVKLTLDGLDHAAYMVDYNFLVEWCNDRAAQELFGLDKSLDPEIETRSLFKLMLNSATARGWNDRDALLGFQLGIAKTRMPKGALAKIAEEVAAADLALLDRLYDAAEAAPGHGIVETRVDIADGDAEPVWGTVFATYFREGILFVHQPGEEPMAGVLEMLSRRDQLIRDVVKHRQPILTPVCVLVGDLQDSVKICAELPPEEYFELVNQLWQMAESVQRRFHATPGKHAGDGMVSYFFPQPDSDYLMNALRCAAELKQAVRALSKEWQLRKHWANELYVNIGLNEGEEWFGTYHTATNVEFTVLGDTINHAGRLSDFARYGAIWVTKNLVGKLNPPDRARLEFGIRRRAEDDREVWVPATYSRLSNLLDLSNERYEKFRDIATLAIAEVVDIAAANDTDQDGE